MDTAESFPIEKVGTPTLPTTTCSNSPNHCFPITTDFNFFEGKKNMNSCIYDRDHDHGMNRKMKPHAACLPFPAQGHINPMLKLAILLHSKGFQITFINTEYNHRRLLKSRGGSPESLNGFPGFEFRTILDGLPPPETDGATQDIPSLCESTSKNCLAPLVALLRQLPVSCVVCDSSMSFGIDAAAEVGIPSFSFRTTNAVNYLAYRNLPELMEKGIIPIKDSSLLTNGYLETKLDWMPSLENVRLRDLPTMIKNTNPKDEFMLNFIAEQAKHSSKASALIFNTFDALEHETLATLSPICPPIHAIGPLHLLINQLPQSNTLRSIGGSLWKEDFESVEWLNSRSPNSVVYVNFGSIAVFTPKQLVELAWGLADSGRDFLWIIRPDAVKGSESEAEYLTGDFLEETKERGLIVKWCPQEKVLNHPSVGAFLTHCGWNSMIESVASGVPMICWPFFADQHINCRFACAEWGVGSEIENNLNKAEVAEMVQELIGGEKGKKMKSKAMEWREKAIEATSPEKNGSSCSSLDRLVRQMML